MIFQHGIYANFGTRPPAPALTVTNGLILRLVSDSGVILDNGKVSRWADSSGNNNFCEQTDPSYRPIFAETYPGYPYNTFNNYPAINININQYLSGTFSAPRSFGDYTIIVTHLRRGTFKNWNAPYSLATQGSGHPLITYIDNTDYIGINNTGGSADNVSILAPLNTPLIAVGRRTGGAANGQNGTLYIEATSNTGTVSTVGIQTWAATVDSSNYLVGKHYTAMDHFLDGFIVEILHYSRSLTDAEINDVRNYMKTKYAI
jgi:hypothetical protein